MVSERKNHEEEPEKFRFITKIGWKLHNKPTVITVIITVILGKILPSRYYLDFLFFETLGELLQYFRP